MAKDLQIKLVRYCRYILRNKTADTKRKRELEAVGGLVVGSTSRRSRRELWGFLLLRPPLQVQGAPRAIQIENEACVPLGLGIRTKTCASSTSDQGTQHTDVTVTAALRTSAWRLAPGL